MFDGHPHEFREPLVLDVDADEVRAARIAMLIRIRQTRGALDHHEQVLLAQIAADPGDSPEWLAKNLAREEVACALRIPDLFAEEKLHTASVLTAQFAGTLRLLRTGEISMLHARILVQASAGLEEPAAAALEAAVLPRAVNQTASAFRRSVYRARARLAPQQADEARAAAMAGRNVRARPMPDGMGQLDAVISAEDLAAVMDVLNAEARRLADVGDERSPDQLRADTLVDRILGRSTTNPGSSGAHVQVTLALSTLVGLDDQPGDLAGYGPIPASMARDIAARPDSVWRRLVTDELGRLVDYGRRTYRPPAGLADHVRAHDQRCVFPTCNRRARDCDLDHLTDWQDHGVTNAENLAAECPRHHQVKHAAGWHVERLPDGTIRWASPTGHVYDKPFDPLPIDRTAELMSDPDPPPF